MKTESKFTYHINPRSDNVGGGFQLKLMEDGQEVGGGVFPVTPETDSKEAYVQAVDAAQEWLQSRELDVDVVTTAQLDDAMIDIETLGKKPGAAVLSIGAVMFGAAGLGATFYTPVQLQSCVDVGLAIDPETVAWWMKQSDEARQAAFRADAPALQVVLQRFTDWFVAQKARYPWCHGATFDVPILDAAYEACGLLAPWKFYDVRDTRTLFSLSGVKVDRKNGTHHNALDDARAQAEAAVCALRDLRAYVIKATLEIGDELVRFCPHCGSVGEVEAAYRNCCPDGAAARYMPKSIAEQCRSTFKLAISAASSTPSKIAGAEKSQNAVHTKAAHDVLAERRRQVEVEGRMPERDDKYGNEELGHAAACYVLYGDPDCQPDLWPWPRHWWKPRDHRTNLVRAGALVLAEIERLDRAALRASQSTTKTADGNSVIFHENSLNKE